MLSQEQSKGEPKDTAQTDPQVRSASNESVNVTAEGGGEDSGGKVEEEAGRALESVFTFARRVSGLQRFGGCVLTTAKRARGFQVVGECDLTP